MVDDAVRDFFRHDFTFLISLSGTSLTRPAPDMPGVMHTAMMPSQLWFLAQLNRARDPSRRSITMSPCVRRMRTFRVVNESGVMP